MGLLGGPSRSLLLGEDESEDVWWYIRDDASRTQVAVGLDELGALYRFGRDTVVGATYVFGGGLSGWTPICEVGAFKAWAPVEEARRGGMADEAVRDVGGAGRGVSAGEVVVLDAAVEEEEEEEEEGGGVLEDGVVGGGWSGGAGGKGSAGAGEDQWLPEASAQRMLGPVANVRSRAMERVAARREELRRLKERRRSSTAGEAAGAGGRAGGAAGGDEGEEDEQVEAPESSADAERRTWVSRALRRWSGGVWIWRGSIREIEGTFGQSTSKVFIFNQWLVVLNVWLLCIWVGLVLVPYFVRPPSVYSPGRMWAPEAPFFENLGRVLTLEAVRDSFLFYGGYTYGANEDGVSAWAGSWYQPDFSYTLAIFLMYITSLVSILYNMSRRLTSGGDQDSALVSLTTHQPFGRLVFGTWDYSLSSLEAGRNLRRGIRNVMKDLLVKASEKGRQRKAGWAGTLRRWAGLLLTLLVFACCVAGVVYTIAYKQAIVQATGTEYGVTALLSLVPLATPELMRVVNRLEGWRDPDAATKMLTAKIYAVKVVNLLALLYIFHDLVTNDAKNANLWGECTLEDHATACASSPAPDALCCSAGNSGCVNAGLVDGATWWNVSSALGHCVGAPCASTADCSAVEPDLVCRSAGTLVALVPDPVTEEPVAANVTEAYGVGVRASMCVACEENEMGETFLRLVLSDTLLNNLVFAAGSFAWHFVYKVPQQFDIPTSSIDLIYEQSLVWMGSVFCPVLPLVGAISHATYFHTRYWVALLTCGPPEKSYGASKASNLTDGLLLSTLLVCTLPSFYVMYLTHDTCGPHVGQNMFFAVGHYVSRSANRWVVLVLQYVSSAAVLVILAIVLLMWALLERAKKSRLTFEVEDLRKEMAGYKAEVAKRFAMLMEGGNVLGRQAFDGRGGRATPQGGGGGGGGGGGWGGDATMAKKLF